jgi:hypothetical protein
LATSITELNQRRISAKITHDHNLEFQAHGNSVPLGHYVALVRPTDERATSSVGHRADFVMRLLTGATYQ